MNIPGLKILDEIIAGLPTNSAQRLELSKLKSEIAAKDKNIAELEAKVAALESSKSGLDPETAKILKVFFQHDEIVAETAVDELGMNLGMVRFYFDQLRESGFIRQSTAYGAHKITPAGRAFIVKNGLT